MKYEFVSSIVILLKKMSFMDIPSRGNKLSSLTAKYSSFAYDIQNSLASTLIPCQSQIADVGNSYLFPTRIHNVTYETVL